MLTRLAVVIFGVCLYSAPAYAQKVEVSGSVGYGASEGITSDEKPLLGQRYDTLNIESGLSYNFTIGGLIDDHFGIEFLWSRQSSELQADGPGGVLPISELAVYNYMGNFVYNWGERDARVRPYLFGGIGATQYSFGALLLTGPGGAAGASIPGDSQLSTNWGGGVKFYPSTNVGIKVGVRWTPTFIRSDPEGYWCDPFYGCWTVANTEYSNQFETAVGLTFRFD